MIEGCDARIHDQSKFLHRQHEFWESVLNPANPTAVVGQDRRTIAFPLPVKGLRLEDSRHFPQLQVEDLIAGAARVHGSGIVARSNDPFLDALRDASLLKALAGGIWPTNLVHPDDLENEWSCIGRRGRVQFKKRARGESNPRPRFGKAPPNQLFHVEGQDSCARTDSTGPVNGLSNRWLLQRGSGSCVISLRFCATLASVPTPLQAARN